MPTKTPDRAPHAAARVRVVELFAGVGGFRRALDPSGFTTVWANQWEPSTKLQHAFHCYTEHFGSGPQHVCENIETVLDSVERGAYDIPNHEVLVGGFPCQDYSVARTLSQALGLQGRKGVLWWQIHRLLSMYRPPWLFLENVDRLLKSPSNQRGRDFAVMLATLANLGYEVEWRVANAADYGFAQKRRRVYLIGRLAADGPRDPSSAILGGVLGAALPLVSQGTPALGHFKILGTAADITDAFGRPGLATPFRSAGYMSHRHVWTADLAPMREHATTLGEKLIPEDQVPPRYYIPESQLPDWRYLKESKKVPREHKASGTKYTYTEGTLPFPDPLDRPARTILTGEGGSTPSRFKHVVQVGDRYRRLTPNELEALNGFPPDWTDTGMPEGRRAFMMGNALVVGVVERIGSALMHEILASKRRSP